MYHSLFSFLKTQKFHYFSPLLLKSLPFFKTHIFFIMAVCSFLNNSLSLTSWNRTKIS
ncbi:hypothetical protein K450DRAFT_226787 [Umbelopsis ramanniana AG]|uniref:Uncharacterized protein n=1 Tax=Umbelopsis ramanniana AG TaxID=1314678 RepID=A0AAD5EFY3_UMBRA|nr:uncharacterized protein K450DRAFT_226787 [Umbelopsis ramanniana AG]KAI8582759.1 hypothetical protein K450DRAFT_226787 [Umbelopsis ramanniana AG]